MTTNPPPRPPVRRTDPLPPWWPDGWPGVVALGIIGFLLGFLIAMALRPKPTHPIAEPPEAAAPKTPYDSVPHPVYAEDSTPVDYEPLIDTTEAFDTSSAAKAVASEPVAAVRLAPAPRSVARLNRPFGPFGLYSGGDYVWGPSPFTASIGGNSAGSVCSQIAEARAKGMQVVLFLTGGSHEQYKTRGKFDMKKWTARMDTYNKTTIKDCIAKAVSDGTVSGTAMVDEPENPDWAGSITKGMLDYMAGYSHKYFPTLPAGVNHGAGGYKWRQSERFKTVDYVNYQYRWDAANSRGNPNVYRDATIKQSLADGVATSYSLQVINGGKPDRDNRYSCTDSDQFGTGNRFPLCRMTPTQIKAWGTSLGTTDNSGSPVCGLLVWTFDRSYFDVSAIKSAFSSVAQATKQARANSCRRP
jgi:hypothetical protein